LLLTLNLAASDESAMNPGRKQGRYLKGFIGSQLQAYYPNEPLSREWIQLSKEITDLYAGSQAGYSDTEFLVRKNALFAQTEELNNKILNTPIAVFH
jgi:hypothetical protein